MRLHHILLSISLGYALYQCVDTLPSKAQSIIRTEVKYHKDYPEVDVIWGIEYKENGKRSSCTLKYKTIGGEGPSKVKSSQLFKDRATGKARVCGSNTEGIAAPVLRGGTLEMEIKTGRFQDPDHDDPIYIADEGGVIESNMSKAYLNGDLIELSPSKPKSLVLSVLQDERDMSSLYIRGGNNKFSGVTIIRTAPMGDSKDINEENGGAVIYWKGSTDNPVMPVGDIIIEPGSKMVLAGEPSRPRHRHNGSIKIGDQGKLILESNREGHRLNDIELEAGEAYIGYENDGHQISGVISGPGNVRFGRFKDMHVFRIKEYNPQKYCYRGRHDEIVLAGVNTYTGKTTIACASTVIVGQEGSLSPQTEVEVEIDSTYKLLSSDQIAALTGEGVVELELGSILSVGDKRESFQFDGKLTSSSGGGLTKLGSSKFLVGSDNALQYKGTTTVEAGVIDFGSTQQDVQSLVVEGQGAVSGGRLVVGTLKNNGQIKVESLVGTADENIFDNTNGSIEITGSANIDLKKGDDIFLTSSALGLSGSIDGGEGEDVVKFRSSKRGEFRAAKIKNFEKAEQLSGSWDYDGDFKASGIETMTLKGGAMDILDSQQATFEHFVMEGGQLYASLNSKNSAPLVADSFDYKGGQLTIAAADQAEPEGTYTILNVPVSSQGEMNELAANAKLFFDGTEGDFRGIGIENGIEGSAIYDIYLQEGSLQLVVAEKSADEVVEDLDCSTSDDEVEQICDPDSPGEDLVEEILEDVLDQIDLPVITDESLAELFISGLAPRNIDGPGRGMATYNNLLADTLFERLPLRQFDPLVIKETVIEQNEVINHEAAPPVRGLWNKSGAVSDEDAQQALDHVIDQNVGTGLEDSTLVEKARHTKLGAIEPGSNI